MSKNKSHKLKKKKKNAVFSKRLMFLLFFRFVLLCYFTGIYLFNKEILSLGGLPDWKGMYVIGGILLASFVLRFIPKPFLYVGGGENRRKRSFFPTVSYRKDQRLTPEDLKNVKKNQSRIFYALIPYLIVTAGIITVYCLKLIGEPEMFMAVMVYYLLEILFINFACPFRAIFMKNHCCRDCRLSAFAPLMIVLPLVVVPGAVSLTLLIVAGVYLFISLLLTHMYPERTLERTNESLQCEKCQKVNCPKRKKELFRSSFSGE